MTDKQPPPNGLAGGIPNRSRRRMTATRRVAYAVTAPILVALVRLMWWTYRFEIRGDTGVRELAARNRPMVLAFWHEALFMMPWYLSRLTELGVGVTYLVSPSLDGDYAVKLLDVIGGRAVRGSATRSGTRAIRGLYRAIVKHRGSPVVAVDGPHGPRHRCKKGPVVLAQLTGAPIVPIAAAPRRAFRLKSWDRLPVPLPFTRVAIEVGDPIEVPKELDEEGVEPHRRTLEHALADASARAAQRSRSSL